MRLLRRLSGEGTAAALGPFLNSLVMNSIARLSAALAIAVGGLVLVGWAGDVGFLNSLHPTWVSGAALGFLLSGLALWFAKPHPPSRHSAFRHLAAQGCAGLVVLIGALTLTEYACGWKLGIDQLLFREAPGAVGTVYSGRMPWMAAVDFFFVGIALLLLGRHRGQIWFFFAASFVALTSLLTLSMFLFHGAAHFLLTNGTEMTMHGTATFAVLALGIWCGHLAARRVSAVRLDEVLVTGSGIVLALLAVMALVAYQNTQRLREASDETMRAQQVKSYITTILATMISAETGTRGFVLTGREEYLEPYLAAPAQIQACTGEVSNLTLDSETQQQRLVVLNGLVQSHLQYQARLIQLVRTRNREVATQAILTGQGKRNMDAMRQMLRAMEAEEDLLLVRRHPAWQSSSVASRLTLILLAGAILAVLLICYHLLKRYAEARRRTEEVLRQSEQRLRGIFDATGDTIGLVTRDGTILSLNQNGINRLREHQGPVVGARIQDILPPEMAAARMKHLDQVFRSGMPVQFEDERGTLVFANHYFPVLAADGTVTEVAFFARDITERRQTQAVLEARSRLTE